MQCIYPSSINLSLPGSLRVGLYGTFIPKYFLNRVPVFHAVYFFSIVIIFTPESRPTGISSILLVYPSGRFRISAFKF